MSTDVGAPLLVNGAVFLGTNGQELQLKPVVHGTPGPSQVPSIACADVAASNAAAAAVLNKCVRTLLPAAESTQKPACQLCLCGVQGKVFGPRNDDCFACVVFPQRFARIFMDYDLGHGSSHRVAAPRHSSGWVSACGTKRIWRDV